MEKDGESNSVIFDSARVWRVIFGNDLGVLADALGDEFFSASSRPFEKRIVVVPSATYKDFLFQRFAMHPRLQMAAGVQVLPLNQAVMEILDSFSEPAYGKKIPSFLELTLAIEEGLHSISSDTQSYAALIAYLGGNEKKEKRIAALSDELARLFARYGLHGKHFLPSWLLKEGWQQTVWKRVFADDSPWAYPLKFLSELKPDCFSGKIALLGFSYLSPAHLNFFCSVPATVFHFSPCALFWEDFSSDKERIAIHRLFKKRGGKEGIREEIDSYMRQSHPLLSNWGKLDREMLKALGSFVLDEKEVYADLQGTSLLHRLQQSLLSLEEPEHLTADKSLQLHSATSKLREVEVLRDVLETLLQERGEPLPLREILVVCPDIGSYAPYIQMVFSKSSFSYSIEGMPLHAVSDTVKGFLEMLALPEKNYVLDAAVKLMRCASFAERRNLSFEEVNLLYKWFKQAEIREGLASSPNSWEQGLNRLLYGLAMTPSDDCNFDVWPIECIPQSEIDLFSKFLELFSELKGDLSGLSGNKNAQEWLEQFLRLADKYFAVDWEKETFFQELKSLTLSSSRFKEKLWSFESIARVLRHLSEMPLGKIPSSKWDKISFVPLSQGSIRAASVICGLGMDETAFPRNDVHSSLCELRRAKSDYFPFKVDEDRSLFLEMLIKAKDALIFSYQRVHDEDGKHQCPSLLIEELEHYLCKRGAAGGMLKIEHPSFPFDSSYFSSDASVKKWLEGDYLVAKAHYSPKQPVLPLFAPKTIQSPFVEECIVDIRQLKKLARYPLKFYFNETLKMYLREEDDEEENEFLISNLQRYTLRKKALRSPIENLLQASGAQGKLPRGLFQDAAKVGLEDEMENFLKTLQGFGVSVDEIFSVHLRATEGLSLSVKLSDSRIVHIVGELEDLTPQGMLTNASNLVSIWPLYLIYRCLDSKNRLLLLTTKGKEKEIPIEDPHAALAAYLDYFFLAKQHPSPLLPEWSKALLHGTAEDFAAAMAKDVNEPYLKYLKRRQSLFNPAATFAQWQVPLKKTFSYLVGGDDAL